ncbi:hypothetical protein ACEK06_11280 [Pseudomonas brenneri]|uniref:hypothetical protein n=1 Tax=Pseudomonas brenneri TaxID=129817 RepID=UPI003570B869
MTAIKERPILFSAPMVRAILDGRKTVTRRAVRAGFNPDDLEGTLSASECRKLYRELPQYFGASYFCPYGQPGDRLWVRETFIDLRGTGVEHRPDPDGPLQRYAYAADCRPGSHSDEARKDFGLKYKPSIHMPRAACRILLEITDVRVERLQDITYEQAAAEGVHRGPLREWCASDEGGACHKYPVPAFRDLWQSVGGNWDANPWVWVVEFKRVTP